MTRLGPKPAIRGRRRFFDPQKKAEFCQLVDAGASVEQAAESMDISLRTVQREMKHDEDFEHEVRLALRSTPDPRKLMEGHARAHWRAAAWLLERTNPEDYGRRPARSCTPFQLDEALKVVVEAALQITPEEHRAQVYAHLAAACETAFQAVLPHYGPGGRRLLERLPPTPLRDVEYVNQVRARCSFHPIPAPDAETRATEPASSAPPTPAESASPRPDAAADPNPNPNRTPNPNRISPAAPAPPRAPQHRRLSWNYLLRAARTATSLVPPSATSARVIDPPMLSPKRRLATKCDDDNNPDDGADVAANGASKNGD